MIPRSLTLSLLALALLLPGCISTPPEEPTDASNPAPAEPGSLAALEEKAAAFVERWWGSKGTLVQVRSGQGPFGSMNETATGAASLEARPDNWLFYYTLPEPPAYAAVGFTREGRLNGAEHQMLTSANAREMALFAPIPRSALDERALAGALQGAVGASSITPSAVRSATYALLTHPAENDAGWRLDWLVNVAVPGGSTFVMIDPATWTTTVNPTATADGGTLQQRASRTGAEAAADPSVTLKVEGIYGARNTAGGSLSSTIDNVSIHVSVLPGAVPIDLGQMIVRFTDGRVVREMNYTAEPALALHQGAFASRFRVDELRDADNSITAAAPVLTGGDLAVLRFYRVELAPRTPVVLALLPEMGEQVSADFTTPATYGVQANVILR